MKPSDAIFMRGGAEQKLVAGVRDGQHFEAQDWLAEEVPVALQFNGISHAVMLATPLDLEDFALGFSLSEGILQNRRELYDVEQISSAEGITLKMDVAGSAFVRLKERRRTMTGRTGCGLCGVESLAQVARPLPVLPDRPPLRRQAIARAMGEVRAQQVLQQATGAVHAAAWCTREGDVALLREDVGRHNALDKLIGALATASVTVNGGFIAVTSRASFEMVQKTVLAGSPLLAAVSASTSFACETAERAGMTLVGFARGDDLVVYTHAQRLTN